MGAFASRVTVMTGQATANDKLTLIGSTLLVDVQLFEQNDDSGGGGGGS